MVLSLVFINDGFVVGDTGVVVIWGSAVVGKVSVPLSFIDSID